MQSNLISDVLHYLPQQRTSTHTLYTHLCELVSKLPTLDINQSQHLAAISNYVKENTFRSNQPLFSHQLQMNTNLFDFVSEAAAENEVKPSPTIFCSLSYQTQLLFRHIGLDFSAEETARIDSEMLPLLQGSKQVRFWGRYQTKTKDYDIVQGVKQGGKGGLNHYTFYAKADKWEELPQITPTHIQQCRLVKHILTGDLNSPIHSYPAFQGQERHFLKAQLLRITHNCEICPKGYLVAGEEDQIEYSEEGKVQEISELNNLENWVHCNTYILKQGDVTYHVDPNLPEEQKEEHLAKLAESDPKVERLKAINEDKGGERAGVEGSWLVKTKGSTQTYTKKEENVSYGVVVLRNCHWPGWYTVAGNGAFASIYIGNGVKATQLPFQPVAPNDLQGEKQYVEEYPEPNPKDPPDQIEPDSDQEKKPIQ